MISCPLASLALGKLPTVGCMEPCSGLACCSTFHFCFDLGFCLIEHCLFGSCPSIEQLEIFCFLITFFLLSPHLVHASCHCTGISARLSSLGRLQIAYEAYNLWRTPKGYDYFVANPTSDDPSEVAINNKYSDWILSRIYTDKQLCYRIYKDVLLTHCNTTIRVGFVHTPVKTISSVTMVWCNVSFPFFR
jgi:hypothetical protein